MLDVSGRSVYTILLPVRCHYYSNDDPLFIPAERHTKCFIEDLSCREHGVHAEQEYIVILSKFIGQWHFTYKRHSEVLKNTIKDY